MKEGDTADIILHGIDKLRIKCNLTSEEDNYLSPYYS